MLSPPYILTIDVGSQSIKAVVFDTYGQQKAESQVPLTLFESHELAAEQWDYFWHKTCDAIKAIWLQDINPQAITGIAITTQRAATLNLDQQGQLLSAPITWLASHRATQLPPINPLLKMAFACIGLGRLIKGFQQKAPVNYLAEHQPQVMQQTHKLVNLSGYLHYRLTGQFKDSVGAQVGFMPFDYRKKTWLPSWHWQWQALAVEQHQLPELVAIGETLGLITEQTEQQTELPAGLPVYATGTDKACEALGSGLTHANDAHISLGTAATVNFYTETFARPSAHFPAYPAATPKGHLIEYQLNQGFWLVSWFCRELFKHDSEQQPSESEQTDTIWQALEQLLADSPVGAQGLVFEPYLSDALGFPGANAKGSFVGLHTEHKTADFYRALIEGILFALKQGFDRQVARHGLRIDKLLVSGGGSDSNTIKQMLADIFNMPVELNHTKHATALGAAITVAVAARQYPDYKQAVEKMCLAHKKAEQQIQPNPEQAQQYQQLFKRNFKPLYRRLIGYYQERDQ